MAPSLRFHHTGVACRDLDEAEARYRALGFVREGEDFEDPVQAIRGRFLVLPGTRIELVAPSTAESPVSGWLSRGVHLYHTAYETDDIAASVAHLKATMRAKVTVAPVPAVAFSMRKIAFLMAPGGLLVELIEAA
ncbi:MAG: VOC family protein [Myxococcales bacterium]|nr:VOC family protein [Myxococcales bacterium]